MTADIIPIQNKRDWKFHVTRITASWGKQVPSIIETGKHIIEAKAELAGASFRAMVQKELPFEKSTAYALIAIAEHPVLSSVQHVGRLPPSWGTLYQLTKLDHDFLAAALKDGTINPKTERKDVTQMLARLEEEQVGKPLNEKQAKIVSIAKKNPEGMTFKALQLACPEIHPQTVKSNIDILVSRGIFVDSGKREKTSEGGRKAAVYKFTDRPVPLVKTKKQKGTAKGKQFAGAVLDAIEAQLVAELKDKTNYQRAKIMLKLMNAVSADISLIYKLKDKELMQEGKITSLRLMGPMPDEFVPKKK